MSGCLEKSGALNGVPFDDVADRIHRINEIKENTYAGLECASIARRGSP